MKKQVPSSLSDIHQSIFDHLKSFSDRRCALELRSDEPQAAIDLAEQLEKVVRSGRRYVKQARTWLAPWEENPPQLDLTKLDLTKAADIGKSFEYMRQHSWFVTACDFLDQLTGYLRDWQNQAEIYREGARARLLWGVSAKEKSRFLDAPIVQQPVSQPSPEKSNTTKSYTLDDLPEKLLAIQKQRLGRFADQMVLFRQGIVATHQKIASFQQRYGDGSQIDFGMASRYMEVIQSLRSSLKMQQEQLQDAEREWLKAQGEIAVLTTLRRPPPSSAKSSAHVQLPHGWSVVN